MISTKKINWITVLQIGLSVLVSILLASAISSYLGNPYPFLPFLLQIVLFILLSAALKKALPMLKKNRESDENHDE